MTNTHPETVHTACHGEADGRGDARESSGFTAYYMYLYDLLHECRFGFEDLAHRFVFKNLKSDGTKRVPAPHFSLLLYFSMDSAQLFQNLL